MTKLDYNRPFLRYIDNIRREISSQSRQTKVEFKVKSNSISKNNESSIFPLTEKESKLVQSFFDAIEHFMDVQYQKIAAISPKATRGNKRAAAKLSIESAQNELKEVAIEFCFQMLNGALNGRRNLLNLYLEMEKGLKEEAVEIWDYINNEIMKESFDYIDKVVDEYLLTKKK